MGKGLTQPIETTSPQEETENGSTPLAKDQNNSKPPETVLVPLEETKAQHN
jgi:hypothetical protein